MGCGQSIEAAIRPSRRVTSLRMSKVVSIFRTEREARTQSLKQEHAFERAARLVRGGSDAPRVRHTSTGMFSYQQMAKEANSTTKRKGFHSDAALKRVLSIVDCNATKREIARIKQVRETQTNCATKKNVTDKSCVCMPPDYSRQYCLIVLARENHTNLSTEKKN